MSFQDIPFHRSWLSKEKNSNYEKLKFSLVSQTQSIIFINFKLFLSLNSMRHTFSPQIAKTYFTRISWNTFQNQMRHFSSWSLIKISSYEFMFSFSVFSRIFIARIWFWFFSQFLKFVFKHFLNSESHEMRKSSTKLIKNHNKSFAKFSSLIIFKLSSCDSLLSLITSRWRIFKSW